MRSTLLAASCVIAALAVAPFGLSEARASGVRVARASAPAEVEAQTRRELAAAVRRELAAQGLQLRLRGYTVAPALIEMRRASAGTRSAQLSCIVDLAISNAEGVLLGTVRGRATAARGATSSEALDAAARSAVRALASAFAPEESSDG